MNVARSRGLPFLVVGLMLSCSCHRASQQLVVLNWDSYFGSKVKSSFENSTHIRIAEKNYASNEELVQMLDGTRADIVFPSTFTVDLLAQKGRLGNLDWSQLRNGDAVPPEYRSLPESHHCIPYTWSGVAVFYDKSRLSGPIGMDTIFDAAKRRAVSGHLMLLDDRRALLGLALRYLGFSINTLDDREIQLATDLVRSAKQDALLFAGGLLVDRIAGTPEIWAGLSWSGDARWAALKRPAVIVEIPRSSIQYVDWACVTAGSQASALAFIDHLLEPSQALDFCRTTRFAPVNSKVEALATPDVVDIIHEFTERHKVLPPEMVKYLGPDGERKYENAWLRVKQ